MPPPPELLREINKLSVSTLKAMNKAIGMLADNSAAKVSTMQVVEILLWIFAVFLSLLVGSVIISSITHPLEEVVATTKKIRSGDLRGTLVLETLNNDELGALQ